MKIDKKKEIALFCFLINHINDALSPCYDKMVQGEKQLIYTAIPEFKRGSLLLNKLVLHNNQLWFPATTFIGNFDTEKTECMFIGHHLLMKFNSKLEIETNDIDFGEMLVPASDFINEWQETYSWTKDVLESDQEIQNLYAFFLDNPMEVSAFFEAKVDYVEREKASEEPVTCRICDSLMEISTEVYKNTHRNNEIEMEYYSCGLCKSNYYPNKAPWAKDGWVYNNAMIYQIRQGYEPTEIFALDEFNRVNDPEGKKLKRFSERISANVYRYLGDY